MVIQHLLAKTGVPKVLVDDMTKGTFSPCFQFLRGNSQQPSWDFILHSLN